MNVTVPPGFASFRSAYDAGRGVLVWRRGVADLNGEGEVPGGIVIMRYGENALDVIDRVKARLRAAWATADHAEAQGQLESLARELEHPHPGAAASLREGLAETLTVQRLGVTGKLKKTLDSTNPIESMIECIRRSSRNVKRWQNGNMALRWTAAGMLEAEQQFRRVIGADDLSKLAIAVEADITRSRAAASSPRPSSMQCEPAATLAHA